MLMRSASKWWHVALLLLLSPVIMVSLAAAAVLSVLSTVCLHLAIWAWWCSRGRDILFVYSESPLWRDYIVEQILPVLGDRAIVLNWSERNRWRMSLAQWAFYHFGGRRNFNPLAVVFRPFRRTRTFRFWESFREMKHGRPASLRALEEQFFAASGVRKPTSV
jgi:hypothetical protein